MKLLYQHPDGGRLLYSPRVGRLILSEPWDNDSETVAAVNIGPEGLRQLAADLYALAAETERKAITDAVSRHMSGLLEYIEGEYEGCEYAQAIVRDYALSTLGAVGDDREAAQ